MKHPESGKWICIDATRAYGTIGRLVNHSPRPNVKGKVAVVDGEVRLGFLALHDIDANEEILVDYGYQPNPPPWMRGRRAKSVSSSSI